MLNFNQYVFRVIIEMCLFFADDLILLWNEVSGSEDSNVYFYDLTRPKHTCVNKLQVNLICT